MNHVSYGEHKKKKLLTLENGGEFLCSFTNMMNLNGALVMDKEPTRFFPCPQF